MQEFTGDRGTSLHSRPQFGNVDNMSYHSMVNIDIIITLTSPWQEEKLSMNLILKHGLAVFKLVLQVNKGSTN